MGSHIILLEVQRGQEPWVSCSGRASTASFHSLIWKIKQSHSVGLLITESLELEGPSKGHLIQLPCNEQGQDLEVHQVLRAPSSLTMSVSRDGASDTSLGNLFQCFTTLTVKSFPSV
uniref:Uncharacterized protein n=1 Tax=Pavo cristatus TaxID=9049 RepID=A0A8C9L6Q9_PAVCR